MHRKKIIFLNFLINTFLFVMANFDEQKSTRIFGGKTATDGQFPYMVDLSMNFKGKNYHLCGATLIHYNWIITAGHCAFYAVKMNLVLNVTLGVTDITNGPHKWSELISKGNIIIHENYTDDGETAVNDVALLKVQRPIFYGSKILPVRLPCQSDSNSFDGKIGIMSGWGFNVNRKKEEANVLQYFEEKILSNNECTAQNVNYPKIVNSEICISSKNGKSACPGDSGSPLVIKNSTVGDILVGIASYVDIGKICDSENNGPVVFMRISYFMDWIKEKTGIKFNYSSESYSTVSSTTKETTINQSKSCEVNKCLDNQVFDKLECLCVPTHDPECPPRFFYDSLLSRCVCVIEKVNCPDGFQWDENQCRCTCPNSEVCRPGFIWSEQQCKCNCNLEKECRKNFIFDQSTCECFCDSKIADSGCPSGSVFDYTICKCISGARPECRAGYKYDEILGDCVCEELKECGDFEVWDDDTCSCS